MTVIFLNDYWIVRVEVESDIGRENLLKAESFLTENGWSHTPCSHIRQVLNECSAGTSLPDLMNRYHIAVVSYGEPQFDAIGCFREAFVKGVGYCPPSLL